MSQTDIIIKAATTEICRPWLRYALAHADWTALAHFAATHGWVLLAHWADVAQAYALFRDPNAKSIVPVSTQVAARCYPAMSPAFPAASWYERMIHDLWGHEAAGAADLSPWLDHGHWPSSAPMAPTSEPVPAAEASVSECPTERDDTMLLPLGPIWGQWDEAAHLRLTLIGPTILRAECRLGFTHKGTLALMRGKSPRAAARFAARLSADATVAHAVAFANASESAMDLAAPSRAVGLRIVMMEIERIAAHLDNLAEVGRLAGANRIWIRCGFLREILLRATDSAFGHRLMMDCVIPGGVATDITADGPEVILRALGDIASELPSVHHLHDATALSSRLSGLGHADRKLAASLGVGGIVGRASGHAFDTRTAFISGYQDIAPRVATHSDGDAAARQHMRIREIEESIRLVGSAFEILPPGPIVVALLPVSGEGIGFAESIRGDVWHWLRLDHGQIAAVFARDPGWALWPLAERVLQQASSGDIDLIRASFALPASGPDL